MNKITGNESYFPFFDVNCSGYGYAMKINEDNMLSFVPGITIQQQMAKDFMAIMLKRYNTSVYSEESNLRECAKRAILATDILIEELNKHNDNTQNPPGK